MSNWKFLFLIRIQKKVSDEQIQLLEQSLKEKEDQIVSLHYQIESNSEVTVHCITYHIA